MPCLSASLSPLLPTPAFHHPLVLPLPSPPPFREHLLHTHLALLKHFEMSPDLSLIFTCDVGDACICVISEASHLASGSLHNPLRPSFVILYSS